VIRSFGDSETEKVFSRRRSKRFSGALARAALKRLLLLDAAETVEDLRVPPGNRPERLSGKRKGQYGIRVNNQWRICFRWERGSAVEVEIVGHH
jgi:proteic killer suppression protein